MQAAFGKRVVIWSEEVSRLVLAPCEKTEAQGEILLGRNRMKSGHCPCLKIMLENKEDT
jgi:hypothetical protein